MSDKVLDKLVTNLNDDFGTEIYSITNYCEFENEVRLLLEKKAELNLLNEEKLKTETQLASLKSRDFWKEISHSLSYCSIVTTIILALGETRFKTFFSIISLVFGILIFICVFLAFPCSKIFVGKIHYYEYKIKLINRFLEEKNKNSNKLQVQTHRKCRHYRRNVQ